MLEKVVEIILQKLLQPRTRQQKADDQVKEDLVFLHEALINCHRAYLRYKSEHDDMNRMNWRKAVDELARILDRIGLALSVFSPDAFSYATFYLRSETVYPPLLDEDEEPGPEHKIKETGEALELKKTVSRLMLIQCNKPKSHHDNDFEEATTKLREFMKERMTAGEILQAQEAYRRDTYWRYTF